MTERRPFRVGSWTADPPSNELSSGARRVRVEPKVMALLEVLAEHAGATLSREFLLENVWPDVVVTEDALSRAVSKLRRALDDDAQSPEYVETIPKGGYRLIASVDRLDLPEKALFTSQTDPAGPTARSELAGPSGGSAGRLSAAILSIVVVILVLGVVLIGMRMGRSDHDAVIRPLTVMAGIETHPALSPDGHRVAFAAASRGAAADFDIWVSSLDDRSPVRLTSGPDDDLRPVWNADGTTLAFLRCRLDRCRIVTVPAHGGPVAPVGNLVVSPWALDWLPAGDFVAAVRLDSTDASSPLGLVRTSGRGDTLDRLTTPDSGSFGDLFARVSPDGARIAFVRHGRSGEEDVWTVPIAGGAETNVTQRGMHVEGVAWHTSGQELFAAASYTADAGLFRVPLGGGEIVPINTGPTRPRHPAFASSRLVFESAETETNVYAARIANDADPADVVLHAVAPSTAYDGQPAVSPDGRRIAWISDRSGSTNVWVAGVDDSQPMQLTRFADAHVGAPRWSRDGRMIVFEAQREETAAIYQVAAEGGETRRLTEGTDYDFAPRFSADGTAIYFGSNRKGRVGLWKIILPDGVPMRVASGYVGEELPGESALLVVRPGLSGLWRVANPEDSVGSPFTPLARTDWGNWTTTRDGLIVTERRGSEASVVLVDPSRGRRTVLLSGIDGLPERYPSVDVSPDGGVVALARTDRVESGLVLVDGVR
ncbi:MAG: winged helix-turn-helix domain-containing protein [Rhodothermales bacterium]